MTEFPTFRGCETQVGPSRESGTSRSDHGDLFHQEHGAGTFDLAGDLAMESGRHSRDATWENLTAFGHETLEQIGIFVVDRLDVDIDSAARHRAVGAAEVGAALWSFGLHGVLFDFAVKRVSVEIGVVFFLFETGRSARAFFIARCDVA